MEKIRYRNLLQFASLWGMSYLVLGFTRYGLSNFYSLLSVSIPYLATEMVYFLIALVAFVLFALAFTGEKITFQRRKSHADVIAYGPEEFLKVEGMDLQRVFSDRGDDFLRVAVDTG